MNKFSTFFKELWENKKAVVIGAAVVVLLGGVTVTALFMNSGKNKAQIAVKETNTAAENETQTVKADKKQEQTTISNIVEITPEERKENDVVNDDDSSIDTDVAVDKETVTEAIAKQEEAKQEQQVADNSENLHNTESSDNSSHEGSKDNNNNDSGSNNTQADQIPEPETEAPTSKPAEIPTEAREPVTHMETKYIYYYDLEGNLYYTDSITYLAYEDGKPVEKVYYEGDTDSFPPDTPERVIIGWKLENGSRYNYHLDISGYSGNINIYPYWI